MKLLDESWEDLPWVHDRDDDLGKVLEQFAVVGQTEVGQDGDQYDMFIVVRVTNLAHATGDDGFLVEAEMAPHPKHLTEKTRERVGGEADLYDIVTYGLGIPIDNVQADSPSEGYAEIKESTIAGNLVPAFLMDKPINRIGTTGWDMLRDAVEDVDAHRATMDRLSEE